MAKELFNQTEIISPNVPADTERIALGTPSVSGAKNIKWSYFKSILKNVLNISHTVGIGGDYATLALAVASTNTRFKLISNTTEAGNIDINRLIVIDFGIYSVNMGAFTLTLSQDNLIIQNGAINGAISVTGDNIIASGIKNITSTITVNAVADNTIIDSCNTLTAISNTGTNTRIINCDGSNNILQEKTFFNDYIDVDTVYTTNVKKRGSGQMSFTAATSYAFDKDLYFGNTTTAFFSGGYRFLKKTDTGGTNCSSTSLFSRNYLASIDPALHRERRGSLNLGAFGQTQFGGDNNVPTEDLIRIYNGTGIGTIYASSISISNGSNIITASSNCPNFLSQFKVGDTLDIYNIGDTTTETVTIASIDSSTQITTTLNYTGTTAGGKIIYNNTASQAVGDSFVLNRNGNLLIKDGNDSDYVASDKLEVRGNIKASGILKATGTTEYADNTAALAGGLIAGDIYRTGDLLKIVH